jgi:hypothetical protein
MPRKVAGAGRVPGVCACGGSGLLAVTVDFSFDQIEQTGFCRGPPSHTPDVNTRPWSFSGSWLMR